MFYKFDNGEWFKGIEVHFPDGTILNHDNKIEKDGWKWFDEAPKEFIDFQSKQLINNQIK